MGEKQQTVGFEVARPVVKHSRQIVGGDQAQIGPQHIGSGFGQRLGQALLMLRHDFAGELLPQAAFARSGGSGEKVGARVVFGKRGLRIACGQQAAADVGIGADECDALGRAREDLQALIGVLG